MPQGIVGSNPTPSATGLPRPPMPQDDRTPERRVFSIRQKILLAFGLAVLAVFVIAILAYRSTRGFIKTADWLAHTRLVLENQETLLRHVTEAETAARGFIITGDDWFLESYQQVVDAVVADFGRLKLLVADDLSQSNRLASLKEQISLKLNNLRDLIQLRRVEGAAAAARRFSKGDGEDVMREIRSIMSDFEKEENRLLEERANLTGVIGHRTVFSVVLGAGVSISLLLIALMLILRDIGVRRRIEDLLASERNLLRSLIDTIPEHIFVKDLRGRYVLDNTAHRKFLKVKDLEEVSGKSVFYFFPQELAALYHADDQAIIRTGQPILNREEPAVTVEGKVIWLSTTKVPLRDVNGQFIGLVCVSTDISERKAAEEKLRMFAAQLERSNKELQDFASVASHDLQEPLRKIQAFADRLRAKCGQQIGEQGLDYLERMQGAANRMQTLIQDLLTLSRVSSKAQPYVAVDLARIVREVLSDLEVRVEQTGASIEVGFLPTIEADPLQMRQLFQNLLSNALKFQKPGQRPEVMISAKVLQVQEHQVSGAGPGDEVCQIMIVDNGIGFEDQFAEQIFALFQRLHSRQEYEGTGIGLAVCRKIAHRHGGSIVAKSAKDQGATFIVTLPVRQITHQ